MELQSPNDNHLSGEKSGSEGNTKTHTFAGLLIVLACVSAVALPILHWYRQHQSEMRDREEYAAKDAARTADLEAALGKLKSTWLANDNWEDDLPRDRRSFVPYSINVEHALVGKLSPLVFFGTVQDVRTAGEQGNSTLRVRVFAKRDEVRLRLSLSASAEQTALILKNKSFHQLSELEDLSKVCIFVANIDRVARIPAHNAIGDDVSYFVGYGTLRDAYASEVPVLRLHSIWHQD